MKLNKILKNKYLTDNYIKNKKKYLNELKNNFIKNDKLDNKISVNGIILILSCDKYKKTRFEKFKLKKKEYKNWKVIYVFADLFMKEKFKLEDNILTIKTEDSYFHLLKKLLLSIKYLYQIFDIKEGILRSGDDLIFNENNLSKFLISRKKYNFIGINTENESELEPNIYKNFPTKNDNFMINYYVKNPSDFNNPKHNMKNVIVKKYKKRPNLKKVIAGTLYYISNFAAKILIDHFKKINNNIFYFDVYTQSYPYIIEDVGVSYILYLNKIKSKFDKNFINQYEIDCSNIKNKYNDFIAIHTQYLKNTNDDNYYILNFTDNKKTINRIYKTDNEYLLLKNGNVNHISDNINNLIDDKIKFDVTILDIKIIKNYNTKLNLIEIDHEIERTTKDFKNYDIIIIRKEVLFYFLELVKVEIIGNLKLIFRICKKHKMKLYENLINF